MIEKEKVNMQQVLRAGAFMGETPKLFGYCTGQVFAINAGMYLD